MLKNITKNLQPAIGLTLGAVGSGIVSKKLPLKNDKMKHGLMLLGGLVLMGSGKGKDKMLGHVGAGIIAASGLNLAQSFGIGGVGDNPVDFSDYDFNLSGPGEDAVSGTEGEASEVSY